MRNLRALLVLFIFTFTNLTPPYGWAQVLDLKSKVAPITAIGLMPEPGSSVSLSAGYDLAHFKGMVIDPSDPFKFDFIIHQGNEHLDRGQKQLEYTKLIKYFLAALAVPDKEQWVNLSPFEKNRIITADFGKTAMGRDLLAQDYLLKQLSSSLTNPETGLGKKFWGQVYEKAYKKFGTSNIPVNTFNKVWIVPSRAVIYEKGNMMYVTESHLKVMTESDYLSMKKHHQSRILGQKDKAISLSNEVMREVIIPEIEKEVNEGKNFAPLRQVFSGMLLATWYKRALKESILARVYANKGKLKGVDQDPKANEKIYEDYIRAYKKGVYNMIKEEADPLTQEVIPRKYFSGGTINRWDEAMVTGKEQAAFEDLAKAEQDRVIDNVSGMFDNFVTPKVLKKLKTAMLLGAAVGSLTVHQARGQSQSATLVWNPPVPVATAPTNWYYRVVISPTPGGELNANNQPATNSVVIDNIPVTSTNYSFGSLPFSSNYFIMQTEASVNGQIMVSQASNEATWNSNPILGTFYTNLGAQSIPLTGIFAKGDPLTVTASNPNMVNNVTANNPSTGGANLTWTPAGNGSGQVVFIVTDALTGKSFIYIAYINPLPPALAIISSQLNQGVQVSQLSMDNNTIPGTVIANLQYTTTPGVTNSWQSISQVILPYDPNGTNPVINTDVEFDQNGYYRFLILPSGLPNNSPTNSPSASITPTKTSNMIGNIAREVITEPVGFGEMAGPFSSEAILPRTISQDNIKGKPVASGSTPKTPDASDTAAFGETRGGIDFSQSTLEMQIKRDGKGVPLPMSQQNLDNIHIDGLVPVILDIKPAESTLLFGKMMEGSPIAANS